MQMFLEILRQTLHALWSHKLRSFLTMFGIAWGVGSLLLLVGLGEGFRAGQEKNLATLGEDVMFLWASRIPAVQGSTQAGRSYRLTYADYMALKAEATLLRNVSPNLSRSDIRATSEYNSGSGQVAGVAASFNKIRYLPMTTGRWINEEDDAEGRPVAVLGVDMAKNLFSGRPAVGSMMLLNGNRFEVIGILKSNKRGGNSGPDMRVFMPIKTMRVLFPMKGDNAEDAISSILYQPRTKDENAAAKEQVHQIVARRHGFDPKATDAFDDWDTIENSRKVGKIFDAMDWFLGFVGLVTLFLGAIGIINIMLVSVTERTHEIGLRKALGATYRNILTQFFLEGAMLTGISGLLGLLGASALVWAMSLLPTPQGFDTPRIIPASAAVAIASLGLAGIAAGLYPARKAALLTPVDALRQE